MAKIEEYGGGLFNCFDDIGVCCVTYFFPCATWGQAMEDAGEGSCMVHGCAISCCPCWVPIATASNAESIDKKLGGQGQGYCTTCIIHCCCFPCATCQIARAVNKAKQQGVLKRQGAPGEEEMQK